ncbi:MAG TPA: glycosyltransferase family 4 protein [Cellulomonas sp.]
MLRIGLVIDDGLDRPDGVQQIVLTLGRRLTGLGHEVHYLTSTTTRTDLPNLHVLAPSLTVKFNGNRLSTPRPASRRALRRLMADVPFDVLHIAMPYSPVLAGRVVSAAPARTAVVGSFLIYPQDALVRWGIRGLALLERRRLRRFVSLNANSEASQESAQEAFGRPVPILGPPVELPEVDTLGALAGTSGTGDADDAGGTGLPTSDEPRRIVFLGRLVERKGPRELLDAVAAMDRLPGTRPWTLTLAGRGPLLDDLRARATAAGIADRVTFPGFIAEEDKTALLAGADLVVLPSTGGECFGISVVEALAAATGVVLAGDNPGYRTPMAGLEDQLVDPADTDGFARALARWTADDRARAAAPARQRPAARRYEAGAITDQVVAWYEQSIAAHRDR